MPETAPVTGCIPVPLGGLVCSLIQPESQLVPLHSGLCEVFSLKEGMQIFIKFAELNLGSC